jgi:hypothetical protein
LGNYQNYKKHNNGGILKQFSESPGDPALPSDFIAKEEKIDDAIAEQITFTRDYEDMGVKAHVWQNANTVFRRVAARFPLRDIRVNTGDPHLEIFADPLLEKVFNNRIDNTLRY